MVKVPKCTPLKKYILDHGKKAKKAVKVNLNGLTEVCTSANSSIITSMARVSISGKMAAATKATGSEANFTAKVCLPGKTADATQVITLKIRSKAMVSMSGPTTGSTMANGKMANSTEKESTHQKDRVKKEVSGLMAKELNGFE